MRIEMIRIVGKCLCSRLYEGILEASYDEGEV